MSVFVAFFVLLLLLADSTPPAASNIPTYWYVIIPFHIIRHVVVYQFLCIAHVHE